MGLEIGGVGSRILQETGSFDNVFEHTTHIAVDIGDGEFTILHALDDLFDLSGLARLHEIVAGLYLSDGLKALADADPVGHHDAFIAPVVAKDLGEQVVITHGVLTVHLIVRCHDGPWVALADGYLKAAEVELAGSTLGNALVDRGAVSFLRVDGEVFGRDTGTLTLYTFNICSRNLTSHKRILTIVFEVTAAEGITVEVHTWTENDVATIFLGLVADSLAYLTDELSVPSRSQTRSDGEGCSIVGLVSALAGRVDAHTGRAVGEYCGRDAQTRNGWGGSCGTSHEVGLTAYDGSRTEKVVCTANE